MKKTIRFALLISASFILSGCDVPSINNYLDTNIVAKDTIALQTTTALTLVNGFADSQMMQQLEEELKLDDNQEKEIPIATLDFFLNNDAAFNIEKRTSDRDGYVYLDIISFNMSEDITISYALYYNLETSDVEINDANGRGNGHHHGGENQGHKHDGPRNGEGNRHNHQNGKNGSAKGKHKHYRVSGLAIVNGDEYNFIAKTENKNNGKEGETALKFRLYKDEQNYIVIKHEQELFKVVNEVERHYLEKFSYVVVENDEVIKQFKHELLKEQDEFILHLTIDGTKYIVKSFTIDERVFLEVMLCDGQTFIFEKIVVTDAETGNTTFLYVLQ